MKERKSTLLALAIVGIVVFNIIGCNKKETTYISPSNRTAFTRSYPAMSDSSESGIYIQPLTGVPDIFYMDRASGKMVFLCGKADCEHGKEGNTDCNAYFEEGLICDSIQISNNKLYILGKITKESNSKLYRMDLDGSNREVVTTINAEAGAGATRIIDGNMYFIGVPNEGNTSVYHLYCQNIQSKNELAKDIFPIDEEEWSARRIEQIYIDEDKKQIYLKESKYMENLEYEGTIWQYDIRKEEWKALFKSSKFFTWFIDGNWCYYSEYNGGADNAGNLERIELVTCSPVKRRNLETEIEETTKIPSGFLEGYDGKYCYLKIYGNKAGDGLKSIDVYTLDGNLVQSIASPVENYQFYDAVNAGVTYDAIVIHHIPSETDALDSEKIYVYDKKNIGQKDGKWERVYLDMYYDQYNNTVDLQVEQK